MDVIVKDNSTAVIMAKNRAVLVALEKIGMKAEQYAVANVDKQVYNTPESKSGYKRTGNLRLGITHQLQGNNSVAVGGRVDYTRYVELGTSKMKPRPFIKPAAFDHLDEYKTTIISELEKLL